MHSCVYEGWVWHRRREPIRHRFRYALAMLYLDLDELSQAFAGRWLWSAGRPSVAWLRRRDYLGDSRLPLDVSVRRFLELQGVQDCRGPIRILTQPRYFGFLMNPVSFYFCFDRDGTELRAVVAEVTNTPWGERKCYLLSGDELATGDGLTSRERTGDLRVAKQLHVSPFWPMDMEYGWRLRRPGARLAIDIRNYRAGRSVFTAALRFTRRDWTPQALRRLLWRYPLMTQRVAVGIYWQAWRLWWKGCPIYPHPQRAAQVSSTTAVNNIHEAN